MQGPGGAQGDQPQGQRATVTAGGSNMSTKPEAVDLSSIPPGMFSLFQQFLETMSKKEEVKEDQSHGVKADQKDGEVEEKEKHMKDIPESSAQGEARGMMNGSGGPYYYRCLTRGHLKEECTVNLFL
jgi:hypothetical protein